MITFPFLYNFFCPWSCLIYSLHNFWAFGSQKAPRLLLAPLLAEGKRVVTCENLTPPLDSLFPLAHDYSLPLHWAVTMFHPQMYARFLPVAVFFFTFFDGVMLSPLPRVLLQTLFCPQSHPITVHTEPEASSGYLPFVLYVFSFSFGCLLVFVRKPNF